MKRREIKELPAKTTKELWDMVKSLKKDIGKIAIDVSQRKAENTKQLSTKKDDLARVFTILQDKRKVVKK